MSIEYDKTRKEIVINYKGQRLTEEKAREIANNGGFDIRIGLCVPAEFYKKACSLADELNRR